MRSAPKADSEIDRMETRICPRCKEPRLVDWFGDRKAPYAICLSCRVEVNGKQKTQKQEKNQIPFRANCAICNSAILGQNEICAKCEDGIKAFDSSTKLLGRAASYVGRNLRGKKRKARKFKQRNSKLQKLIQAQRRDANDNYMRFEHAITK